MAYVSKNFAGPRKDKRKETKESLGKMEVKIELQGDITDRVKLSEPVMSSEQIGPLV